MYKKNSKVTWKYLGRPVHGTVEEVFEKPVTKTIKGKKITRNGSPEIPAYLVRSEAGNIALKLESELQKTAAPRKASPRLFG
jgi:hypothetical protein